MICDLQKASLLKRASAWLLDIILLAVLACGIGMLLSSVLGYDGYVQQLNACYEKYEREYEIDFEHYDELTEAEQERYEQANRALQEDEQAVKAYNMLINLSLILLTGSVLLSYLALEFGVPLLFGNGQTVGKKIFGIGLMREDGVKITPFALFVRTVLGKCTIGTLVPLFVLLMMFLGVIGVIGPTLLLALLLLQAALILTSKTHAAIHDRMAATVAVDLSSQMIFDSPEALVAYKNQLHTEEVKNRTY